eukprot:jgi/Mesvir1/6948/Mv09098-RA.1
MEVEVKLALKSAEDHEKLGRILKPYHQVTYMQENIFFDGANKELSSRSVVFRIRFYDENAKCTLTLKGEAVLQDGVSRASEEEVEMEPLLARQMVADPSIMSTSTAVPMLQRVRETYGIRAFKCLGGFRNIRAVHNWEGYVLELDETQFVSGSMYELECETDKPEEACKKLVDFLTANGVQHSFSTESKFKRFAKGIKW